MATRRRLDVELVRRGLAPSRETAQRLILAGRVRVAGTPAHKAATMVADSAAVVVVAGDEGYASRGAHKLVGALRDFVAEGMTPVRDRHCLDAGASTGGFTDVLLRAGARTVTAVDVGYGQLIWRLRNDPRVIVRDRSNVRHLTPEQLDIVPSLVVADLSFISLRLALPALAALCRPDGDLVVMVKPQFEVGATRIGRNGVVKDARARADAVAAVAACASAVGWPAVGITRSELPGPAGNIEYFLWLRSEPGRPVVGEEMIRDRVEQATNP